MNLVKSLDLSEWVQLARLVAVVLHEENGRNDKTHLQPAAMRG